LIAGNLLEAEYTEAKVGRRVEVVFEKLNDDITLPQFRLAATNSAPSLAGTIGGGLTRRRALALVGGILAPAIPPNMSPAAQAENIRSAVAPTGKLRAAINIGNANLAAKEAQTGELRGVAVDLSRSFASRLGLPVVLVEYRNVGAIVDHARSGAWDIAFLAVDPARTELDFSPSYMEVENGCLVPAASSIQSAEDIDRIGVRIAVPARSAPDLFLSRTLKQATLVRRDTERAAFEAFRGGEADVIATARSAFLVLTAAAPGYRELPELLLAVPHSIAVPKGETEALAAVSAFVEQAKASGEVARAIADSNLIGLRVAPAASVK
jgi:polar amino acid transport system substrate-binding protein